MPLLFAFNTQVSSHRGPHKYALYFIYITAPITQLVEQPLFEGGGGCRFESGPHNTKGVKNGTSSSLADTRIKRGCARKIE